MVSGDAELAAAFAPFERKMRAEGLPDLVIRDFRRAYAQLRGGGQGTQDELPLVGAEERLQAEPDDAFVRVGHVQPLP